jgi:DNA-binding GntR family transcriptional regulator
MFTEEASLVESVKSVAKFARRSLRHELADRLFAAIVSGELQPGERLGEIRLARQLGVGQSTLREALQELEYRGLLIKKDNRGTFVTNLTVELVEEIYTVRLELEPLAAALATRHITAESLVLLRGLVEKMRKSPAPGQLSSFINCDMEFHRAIWRYSGNSALQRALEMICPPLFAFYLVHPGFAEQLGSDLESDAHEHINLIEALESGNAENARSVFRRTLENFRERHIQHVRTLHS